MSLFGFSRSMIATGLFDRLGRKSLRPFFRSCICSKEERDWRNTIFSFFYKMCGVLSAALSYVNLPFFVYWKLDTSVGDIELADSRCRLSSVVLSI